MRITVCGRALRDSESTIAAKLRRIAGRIRLEGFAVLLGSEQPGCTLPLIADGRIPGYRLRLGDVRHRVVAPERNAVLQVERSDDLRLRPIPRSYPIGSRHHEHEQ